MAAARSRSSVIGMNSIAEHRPVARGYRRFLPVAALLILAPFCAEYLIGSISIRSLPLLPFLIPLYGAAAVLIREISRRIGGGWSTILPLGAAFGVFQAGIVDGSLFNTRYAGLDLTGAQVPVLDFSAVFGLAFVMNHMMLSIGAPIALIEALAPDGQAAPWLGRFGVAVTALCYLAGSLLIGADNWAHEHFYPSPLQLASAAVTIAVLIAVALGLPRRRADHPSGPRSGPRPESMARAPGPWRVGGFTALVTGGYFFVPPNWFGVVLGLFLIGLTARLFTRWSRAVDWGGRHRIALAAGALFTGAWGAPIVGYVTDQTDAVTRIGNVIFALLTSALVIWTARRSRSPQQPEQAAATASLGPPDGPRKAVPGP